MKTTAHERRLWWEAIVQARRERVSLRIGPESLSDLLDDADRCAELELWQVKALKALEAVDDKYWRLQNAIYRFVHSLEPMVDLAYYLEPEAIEHDYRQERP